MEVEGGGGEGGKGGGDKGKCLVQLIDGLGLVDLGTDPIFDILKKKKRKKRETKHMCAVRVTKACVR